jgi:hypothetical protein
MTDRRTPTWSALEQARKALAPAPTEVADLSDDQLMCQYALAMRDAGKLGVPTGDLAHDAALAQLERRLRTMSDTELQQMKRACLDLLKHGANAQ